ncbi:choice-of-anchor M domain-containing protein [Rothia sp. SD9660Na]|uniref:choice-of-anchor M domain-containing protein n=1 Tax=Rothia sp. SD9660Na TaxID=3047030 RepID=UPI0024BBDAD1|nr:choice-of-anchor M domain-containing protein [Rothia sp. SD9660Na]WHS50350.1 choice-of-anchor M domain-containing protein [Rothia sp. SD9660Na]
MKVSPRFTTTLALAALLVPASALAPAAYAAEENKSAEERALEQTLSPDEPVVSGQHEIAAGHVDMGPAFVEGSWELMFRDDSTAEPVWRDPAEVVLRGNDTAMMAVPDDPRYSFVQASPGEQVYVIPQTELAGVVWPGWNTQNPQVVERLGRGVTFTLEAVEGPGGFSMYLENGTFGAPEVLWTSDTTDPQDIFVEPNVHTHANWVFTAPGAYYLTVRAHAELADGTVVSDTARLLFAVGSTVTNEQVFAGADALGAVDKGSTGDESQEKDHDASAQATEASSTAAASGSSTNSETGNSGSPLPVGLIAGGGAVLLALIVGGVLLARRSAAAKAEAFKDFTGGRA